MTTSKFDNNPRRKKIKEQLEEKRSSCAVGIPESKFVENVGGIIRTANAFLIKEIVISEEKYQQSSSVGTFRWENIVVQKEVIAYLREKEYQIITLEQHPKSVSIWDFRFPVNSAIIVGHESAGLPDQLVDQADYSIEIPQFGLVESLNVATATSIALYEYTRQHRHR